MLQSCSFQVKFISRGLGPLRGLRTPRPRPIPGSAPGFCVVDLTRRVGPDVMICALCELFLSPTQIQLNFGDRKISYDGLCFADVLLTGHWQRVDGPLRLKRCVRGNNRPWWGGGETFSEWTGCAGL